MYLQNYMYVKKITVALGSWHKRSDCPSIKSHVAREREWSQSTACKQFGAPCGSQGCA